CGMLFFFSSRRRHTRFSRDWSSDVCSSDLNVIVGSDRADWIAGLNLWTDRFRENGQTAVPLRDYNQSTFGAFVQNNFHAANWLELETGLRGDYVVDYGFALLPRMSALFRVNAQWTSRLGGGVGY